MNIGLSINAVAEALEENLGNKRIQFVSQTNGYEQVVLMGLLTWALKSRFQRKIVLLSESTKTAKHFAQLLEASASWVHTSTLAYISSWGKERYVEFSHPQRQRIQALTQLQQSEGPSIVATTLKGVSQLTLPKGNFESQLTRIEQGQTLDMDEFVARLTLLGYRNSRIVNEPGLFTIRGGIVDIFSVHESTPVRVEFMGDEIASIRGFATDTQRSTTELKAALVAPVQEVDLADGPGRKQYVQRLYEHFLASGMSVHDREGIVAALQTGSHFAGLENYSPMFRLEHAASIEYADPESDLIVCLQPLSTLQKSYEGFVEACEEKCAQDEKSNKAPLPVSSHFLSVDHLMDKIAAFKRVIEFGNSFHSKDSVILQVSAPIRKLPSSTEKTDRLELFNEWTSLFAQLKKSEFKIVIFYHNDEQMLRLRNLLNSREFETTYCKDVFQLFLNPSDVQPQTLFVYGMLDDPFLLQDEKLLLLSEQHILGTSRESTAEKTKQIQGYFKSYNDLQVDCIVIHVQHGMAQYKGLQTLEVGGNLKDFIHLEFADNDKLYLPIDKLNLLQKYQASTDNTQVKLDRLKGQNWTKRKSKTAKAVKDLAESLLKVHAERALVKAPQMSKPSDLYFQFEADFPYDETDDQLKAIKEVNHDLSRALPMDRLICGDVGFGKTEVALRAAMRAASEGFQTMVLVPTTVLCHQHYLTFKERFSRHGVIVDRINRFTPSNKAKEILADLKSGKIDILVGTHRLLSKDIEPSRLGLLIVDEEQRFGVTHKETLKYIARGVHVLTMTATPIPRTLHLAMLGLKDVSLITTAPRNRLAIKTYVSEFDDDLIKEAIKEEVSRGGQVFFVHNRVENIVELANHIKKLVPGYPIRIAHGQMSASELETAIIDFVDGKFPILLCTTIIESGVDMPNVNTLIVNQAERFGLAQLYQLRGRVGRSHRQSFAYLMTGKVNALSDEAKKRLEVLTSYQELGSGFHIAQYDLEIRGAGNLLGAEQSGHIDEVGFELYTQMLEREISRFRGQKVTDIIDTELKLPMSAIIPADYINDERDRIGFYKRIFGCEDEQRMLDLKTEMQDRYGPIPNEVIRLFYIAIVKSMVSKIKVEQLSLLSDKKFELKFASLNEKEIAKIIDFSNKNRKFYQLTPDYRVLLIPRISATTKDEATDMLATLRDLVQPLYFELSNS
ncbi:MAG: transcription-repair coupling factor [Oligoflexales bacterium]